MGKLTLSIRMFCGINKGCAGSILDFKVGCKKIELGFHEATPQTKPSYLIYSQDSKPSPFQKYRLKKPRNSSKQTEFWIYDPVAPLRTWGEGWLNKHNVRPLNPDNSPAFSPTISINQSNNLRLTTSFYRLLVVDIVVGNVILCDGLNPYLMRRN